MFGERIPQPFAVPQMEKPDLGPQIQMPAPKKKAGMFGGGAGQFLTNFILNLAASRGNPGAMASLQMLQQRRQQAAEQEQYGQRREDAFQDYVRKQAWEIANNPKSQQPHYFEDNSGNLMAVGPDGQPRMVHKDPLQWKLVPNGLGGVVPVNIQQLMGNQQQEEILDELPQGAKPIGGPTPSASGGFPGPY